MASSVAKVWGHPQGKSITENLGRWALRGLVYTVVYQSLAKFVASPTFATLLEKLNKGQLAQYAKHINPHRVKVGASLATVFFGEAVAMGVSLRERNIIVQQQTEASRQGVQDLQAAHQALVDLRQAIWGMVGDGSALTDATDIGAAVQAKADEATRLADALAPILAQTEQAPDRHAELKGLLDTIVEQTTRPQYDEGQAPYQQILAAIIALRAALPAQGPDLAPVFPAQPPVNHRRSLSAGNAPPFPLAVHPRPVGRNLDAELSALGAEKADDKAAPGAEEGTGSPQSGPAQQAESPTAEAAGSPERPPQRPSSPVDDEHGVVVEAAAAEESEAQAAGPLVNLLRQTGFTQGFDDSIALVKQLADWLVKINQIIAKAGGTVKSSDPDTTVQETVELINKLRKYEVRSRSGDSANGWKPVFLPSGDSDSVEVRLRKDSQPLDGKASPESGELPDGISGEIAAISAALKDSRILGHSAGMPTAWARLNSLCSAVREVVTMFRPEDVVDDSLETAVKRAIDGLQVLAKFEIDAGPGTPVNKTPFFRGVRENVIKEGVPTPMTTRTGRVVGPRSRYAGQGGAPSTPMGGGQVADSKDDQ